MKAHFVGFDEVQVPLGELGVPVDPAAPIQTAQGFALDRPEPFDKTPGDRLLPDARALQESRYGGVHLPRGHGLDEIALERRADRLGHR